jgi:hypothetical protein
MIPLSWIALTAIVWICIVSGYLVILIGAVRSTDDDEQNTSSWSDLR